MVASRLILSFNSHWWHFSQQNDGRTCIFIYVCYVWEITVHKLILFEGQFDGKLSDSGKWYSALSNCFTDFVFATTIHIKIFVENNYALYIELEAS